MNATHSLLVAASVVSLVAWPAEYDVTGVMTFVVNQDGVLHQKDLGPDTDKAGRAMTVYDPDATWETAR